MTHQVLQVSEPHPKVTGAYRHYYVVVDVAMTGSDWVWRQVDYNGAAGAFVGNVSSNFPTETDAISDAARVFGGTWEGR